MFLMILGNLMAVTAEDAAWLLNAQTDLDKAFEKAKKEKKKVVLLVVVKDGCNWCDLMVHETLTDPDIQSRLGEAVTVVVDIHRELPEAFRADLTPTIFFIDAERQKSILKEVGYVKKGSFLIDIVTAFDNID